MAQVKRYPFNYQKNAHSIEFRVDRLYCLMHDMEIGELPWNEGQYDRMNEERQQLQRLLLTMRDTRDSWSISWLTGKEIGLAKRTVLWASETRAQSCIERGRLDLLQYC